MSGAWDTTARRTMWSGRWRASTSAPPKFIWVRLGNCTTLDVAQLLRLRRDDIIGFAAQHEATVLELG